MKADMQNRDAEALILRVRQGEQAAFSALLTMYEPLIAKRVGAFSAGLSREDTEDLRQNIFLVIDHGNFIDPLANVQVR